MRVTRLSRKIKRLIDWAPVIWKDEDWDYGFILQIMDYKLKRMEPAIRDGYAADAQKLALEIQQARLMISNIQDDPEDEWGLHWNRAHQFKEMNQPCPESDEACRKALTASTKRNEVNWHRLWRHLDKHMRSWWD